MTTQCGSQNLPILYLTISCILSIIGFQCPWILVQFGWFFGWVYLRFYKKNPNDTLGGQDTYGDRSETFSLVSWFPPFLQYVYLLVCFLQLIEIQSPRLTSRKFCLQVGHPPALNSFSCIRYRTRRLWSTTPCRNGTRRSRAAKVRSIRSRRYVFN